jgi:hypothetical protein
MRIDGVIMALAWVDSQSLVVLATDSLYGFDFVPGEKLSFS